MLFTSMFELNKSIKESTMDFNGKIMVTDEPALKRGKHRRASPKRDIQ